MPRVTAALLGTFWDCRLRASSPTHPHTVALLLQTFLLNMSEQGKKWFVFIFKHISFFYVFRLPGLFELTTNIRSSGSPDGSVVKNLPANAGDMGSIPGSGNPLEEEMATHSSILAWRIPWTGEPGRLQSVGSQRVGHDLATKQQQTQILTSEAASETALPFPPAVKMDWLCFLAPGIPQTSLGEKQALDEKCRRHVDLPSICTRSK